VLIHSWNFSSGAQLRSIVAALQQAAAAGEQPPLLTLSLEPRSPICGGDSVGGIQDHRNEESVEEDENDGVEPREAQRAPGVMP
jgi:hypothetical protein